MRFFSAPVLKYQFRLFLNKGFPSKAFKYYCNDSGQTYAYLHLIFTCSEPVDLNYKTKAFGIKSMDFILVEDMLRPYPTTIMTFLHSR